MTQHLRVSTPLAVLRWLPTYRAEWLWPDLVAGLTLTAYLIPAGIGDASLAEATPPSLYSLGCKVHHAEYGVGTVIGIEGSGDQQKVTVSFSIVGSKKFLPRFARLERL